MESASVLEVVAGPAQGARVELEDGVIEVGRSAPGAGNLGDDAELSRRHARIERLGDGRLLVEDLGSRNGTLVNGTRIAAPTLLADGDELSVGASTLRVAADQPADLEPPPPPERSPALRVVAGTTPGAIVRVGDGITLGSQALGDDPDVADEHARVAPISDGRLLVEDLGSEAGTFVGESRIRSPTLVSIGERLRLGGTTLEAVEAAAGQSGAARGRVGGVRQVPEGLFARIGQRAPVEVKDVLPVFALIFGWALAGNLLLRAFAIEVLDVPGDLSSLKYPQLLILSTFAPVAGNSFGFYMTFRRPGDRSMLRYMLPTIGVPLGFLALNLITLNHYGFKEVLVTTAVTLFPTFVSAPLMLRLRARVARERVSDARGS